jgi:hypothetical protein
LVVHSFDYQHKFSPSQHTPIRRSAYALSTSSVPSSPSSIPNYHSIFLHKIPMRKTPTRKTPMRKTPIFPPHTKTNP